MEKPEHDRRVTFASRPSRIFLTDSLRPVHRGSGKRSPPASLVAGPSGAPGPRDPHRLHARSAGEVAGRPWRRVLPARLDGDETVRPPGVGGSSHVTGEVVARTRWLQWRW